MKKLFVILSLLVLSLSCNKVTISDTKQPTKKYYRIKGVQTDGTYLYSKTYIRIK